MKKKHWISINDKLPKDAREVLVHAPDCDIIGPVLVGNYFNDSNSWTVYSFGGTTFDALVTHWMPIVKPY